MIERLVSVMASSRFNTRRATNTPPASPSTTTSASDHLTALAMTPASRSRSSVSRPTSRR